MARIGKDWNLKKLANVFKFRRNIIKKTQHLILIAFPGKINLNEWVIIAFLALLKQQRVKALANEDTLLRTHCCRHKCFPVCPRAQHLLRTQKVFLSLFRNILWPQQMLPSLRSMETQHYFVSRAFPRPRNIISNNVSSFARALRPQKFRPERGFEPWPLRCRCSALLVKLSGQLGAGRYVGRI